MCSTGDIPIVKKLAKQSGYTGSDLDKAGQKIEKTAAEIAATKKKAFNKAYSSLSAAQKKTYDDAISGINKIKEDVKRGDLGKGVTQLKEGVSKKIELAKETVKRSDLGSGAIESSVKRSDFGRLSNAWNRLGKDASKARTDAYRNYQKQRASFNQSMRNRYRALARQARAGRDHLGKQLSISTLRNFSLKRSIRGTASGASEMYRRGDFGKTMRYLGKRTGYTGSDLDKTMQKVEKEGANVVNQTLDFVDSPAKVIQAAGDRASNFVESVKKDLSDTATAYGNVITNIGETGEKIGEIATDTFNTGMNVSTALGSNLSKQVMKARSDLSSAMGGITGGMEEETSSRADLLAREREKRRGGLSRSGTSRTLITGKY